MDDAGKLRQIGSFLDRRIDGVILGWGSLAHVVCNEDRVALLRAFRSVAPDAPVLASYNVRGRPTAQSGRAPAGWTRRAQRLFEALHIPTSDAPPVVGFSREYGFRYAFGDGEIDDLASQCGYRVARTTTRDFPNSILVPHPTTSTEPREPRLTTGF